MPLRTLRLGATGIALALLVARVASAHGPTIQVSASSVRPAALVVQAGQTVHFRNANSSSVPVVLHFEQAPAEALPAEGEALRSPAMGRAGDWHYRFEVVGEYRFVVEGFSARGSIQVVPAED